MKQRALQNRTKQAAVEGLGDAPIPLSEAVPVSRIRAMDPKDLDLVTFVKDKMGGIKTEGEELATELTALSKRESGFIRPTTGAPPTLINNKSGKTLQELADAAEEFGFTFTNDKRELLDELRDSVTRGVKIFSRFGGGEEAMLRASGQTDEFIKQAKELRPEDYEDVLLSFRDLMRLRSGILADKRALGPEQHAEKALLNSFDTIVREKMDKMAIMATEAGDAEVMQRYDTMRTFAAKTFPMFETHVGDDILGRVRHYTVYDVPDADVMRRVWNGQGGRASFDQALRILSGPEQKMDEGLEAIWTYVSNDFYGKVFNAETGKVIPKKYHDWMKLNEKRLDLLPEEMQKRFKTVGELQKVVDEVEDRASRWATQSEQFAKATQRAEQKLPATKVVTGELGEQIEGLATETTAATQGIKTAKKTLLDAEKDYLASRDDFAKTAVGRVLNAEHPDEALYHILDQPTAGVAQTARRNREVRELFDAAGDDQNTKDGLLWLMWKHFKDKQGHPATPTTMAEGIPIFDGPMIQQFVDKYKGALDAVIPGHVQALEKIAKGMTMARSGEKMPRGITQPLPRVLSTEPTNVRQEINRWTQPITVIGATTVLSLVTHPLYAALAAGTGVGTAAWNHLHDGQKLRLLTSIFADSSAADVTAMMLQPNIKAKVLLPRLYTTLVNLGVGSRTDAQAEETEQESPAVPPSAIPDMPQ